MIITMINAWHAWKWKENITEATSVLGYFVGVVQCRSSHHLPLVEVIHFVVVPSGFRSLALLDLRPFIPLHQEVIIIRYVSVRQV